jgi:uncharacterized protein YjbI with pentapeptide repeats
MNFYDPPSTSRIFCTYTALDGVRLFSYGLLYPFALNETGQATIADPLFSVWSLTAQALGEEAILDQGWPKTRGEFIAYGAAYQAADSRSQPVSARISVGELSKQLAVYGNRKFNAIGMAGAPAPFTRMPITPNRAFGGASYAANPLGKGAEEVFDEFSTSPFRPLPNVELPSQLMISPGDTPQPAGFWALSPDLPQRAKYLGKFDKTWLKNRWPHVPSDTKLEFFQSAPPDQQAEGYFRGDERIQIRNMHPTQSIMQAALPGLRARIFFEQRAKGKDQYATAETKFIECPTHAETVWLFPELGCGLLLFRSSLPTNHPSAQDILSVYSILEPLNAPRDSIEVHQQCFLALTQPVNDQVLQVQKLELAEVEAQAAALQAETLVLQAELAQLKAMTPAQKAAMVKKDLIESFKKDFTPPTAEQKQAIELLQKELTKVEKTIEAANKTNTPALDRAKLAELQGHLDKAKAGQEALRMQFASPQERVLAQFAENPKNADLVAQLKNAPGGIEKLFENLDPILDQMLAAEFVETTSTPPPAKNDKVATQQEEQQRADQKIRDQLVQYRLSGQAPTDLQLLGVDLSDLDLQGMDFSGMILSETSFNQSNLTGAKFDQAILSGASFMGAKLNQASLKYISAGKANFKSCDLSAANLYASDLSECDLSAANLKGASLSHANFSDAKLIDANLSQCTADYVTFNACNMRSAKLNEVSFAGSSFQRSVMLGVDMTNAKCPKADLCGANLASAVLLNTQLDNSQADAATTMFRCNLTGANLSRASWLGVNLESAILNQATLNDADLSGARLLAATMIRAVAKGANLSGSSLDQADLSAINLFQGSLANACLSGCRLDIANLYGVDFLDSNWEQASIKDSIIHRTIIALRQA